MGEEFPDFLVPLVALGGLGAVFAAVGLFFRIAGNRMVEEPGVVVVHPEHQGIVVRWGGPGLDEHLSVPLPAFRRLRPGDHVRIRHRPGEIEAIEILGPNVRGTYLFFIAGVAVLTGAVFSLLVLITG